MPPASTDASADYPLHLDAWPEGGLAPEPDAPAEYPALLDAKSEGGLSPETPAEGADAKQDVPLPEDGSMGVVDAGTDTTPPITPIDSQALDAGAQPDIGGSGPTITSFFAGASSINAGHATTLTAIFSGGTGVITPGDVPVLSGVAVSTGILNARTTFTLTVSSPGGQTAVATVSVAVLMPPQTIATGSGWLAFLVTDGSNLYYVVGPSILKVANTGGTPVPIAAATNAVSAIATDGTNVYWTDSNEGTVSRVSVSGAEQPVTLATGQYYANTIAVAGDSVYWTNQGSLPPGTDGGVGVVLPTPADNTGFVRKVGIVGGMQPVTLASGQSKPDSIVVYGASVYWKGSSNDLGTVISTVSAVGGDSPRDLAVGLIGVTVTAKLAANSSGLHWMGTSPSEGIVRLSFAGGASSTVIPAGTSIVPCLAGDLAIDADNAYWTCPGGMSPSLFEAAFDEIGPPAVLASTDQATAQGRSPLAVDATDLYWGRNSSPPTPSYSIVKVQK